MTRLTDKHHITGASHLLHGRANYAAASSVRGIEMTPIVVKDYGVIVTADPNGVIETQDLTAAGVYSGGGFNGALVDGGIGVFDVPRNVVAAWTGTAILTVTGLDEYGEVMRQVSASGTSLTGTKAFKRITSVSSNANITGLTVGSGVLIGLPHRVDANNFWVAKVSNAIDAATFVPAVTATATGTTGDVRGTLSFAAAPNDTRFYSVMYKVASARSRVGAYGVAQF